MEKILFDTDIGGDIDDAICLAYLLREPRCELLGITTVCGEPDKRAAIADAICQAAGKHVPIAAGLDSTLQPIPVYPTPDGAAALGYWRHNTYSKSDAPSFLYQKIKENPHEVVLIGTGNMTNIATMFTAHPDAAGLLKGLYVMNGYFGDKPLPEPYYNWNSWADPLASKIVFSARTSVHRAVPLDVTDSLTIRADQAEILLRADSDLMRAVFSFGSSWLKTSEKLTLHDPLAAVSVFHPDICRFERGFVHVETEQVSHMGGTEFIPDAHGNLEIARYVDREAFYRILSTTLCGEQLKGRDKAIPSFVINRARSAGAAGEAWLANLDNVISKLENRWHISVGDALSGGTHAFAAYANGEKGEKYVLKIDMPENLGGDFSKSIAALKIADGHGYSKLYEYDLESKACLLERLGPSVDHLGYPVEKRIEIICSALKTTWAIPTGDAELQTGDETIAWFREFIGGTWKKLDRPCSQEVIDRAFSYLLSREVASEPSEFVLLHGDAHGGNTLRTLSGDAYKMIDPDGMLYEKAYDLGVLMREWRGEYLKAPIQKCMERCEYLHRLTDVDPRAIFEWGFLQCVSTGLLFFNIDKNIGKELLGIAEAWLNIR